MMKEKCKKGVEIVVESVNFIIIMLSQVSQCPFAPVGYIFCFLRRMFG